MQQVILKEKVKSSTEVNRLRNAYIENSITSVDIHDLIKLVEKF